MNKDGGPYAKLVPHPSAQSTKKEKEAYIKEANEEYAEDNIIMKKLRTWYLLERIRTRKWKGFKSDWKVEAEERIREADVVLFLHSDTTNKRKNIKNIRWEIKTAKDLDRNVIMYCLKGTKHTEVPKWLSRIDGNIRVYTNDKLKSEIIRQATRQYQISDQNISDLIANESNPARELAIEQYKMYKQDTENAENKRLSVNNFYFTLHGILFAALPVVLSKELNPMTLSLIGAFYYLAGRTLNNAWRDALQYYESINRAKQRIINRIEEDFPLHLNKPEYYDIMKNPLNKGRFKSFKDASFPDGFMKIYKWIGICSLLAAIALAFLSVKLHIESVPTIQDVYQAIIKVLESSS